MKKTKILALVTDPHTFLKPGFFTGCRVADQSKNQSGLRSSTTQLFYPAHFRLLLSPIHQPLISPTPTVNVNFCFPLSLFYHIILSPSLPPFAPQSSFLPSDLSSPPETCIYVSKSCFFLGWMRGTAAYCSPLGGFGGDEKVEVEKLD